MAVDNYTTVEKSSINDVIKDALGVDHITSASIDITLNMKLRNWLKKQKKMTW